MLNQNLPEMNECSPSGATLFVEIKFKHPKKLRRSDLMYAFWRNMKVAYLFDLDPETIRTYEVGLSYQF